MDKSQLHFLFSSHPLKPRVVEETFADQFDAIKNAGFSASTIPDEVIDDGRDLRGIPADALIVYRGWMLNAKSYTRLQHATESASAKLLTTTEAYLAAHHLPNWYGELSDLTPETVILPEGSDYESEIRRLDWGGYFVKDYVKSITSSSGSIIREPSEITKALEDFTDYRGEPEGGLCIRRVEPFLPETESRHFVLGGQAYAPPGKDAPELVSEVARRIQLPFYSVDVIERDDGEQRLVEIGDGQVSDLKKWPAEAFAAIWGAATA